ncbi:MAG TPA: DUF3224 domain-containing protein [Phototrophicaceae bacterium]|nr:DUF3224 domain-containing protein [Phototrophicaceae bacterium]
MTTKTVTTVTATGSVEVKSWEEKTWDGKAWNEVSGSKLTRAVVEQDFHGDLEATSRVEFEMFYPDDQSSTYIGLQQVTGSLGGKSGSFVLQINGTYAEGTAKSTFSVVPNSGSGELRGLKGTGSFISVDHTRSGFTFDYELE